MRKGVKFPFPASLLKPMVCAALTHTAYGRHPAAMWSPKHVRSMTLNLMVEEISPSEVRLCLEGCVRLEQRLVEYIPRAPERNTKERREEGDSRIALSVVRGDEQLRYDPRVLGCLNYDLEKKVFTRFDIVALGNLVGWYGDANDVGEVIGPIPLGVAISLDSGSAVPPGKWHRE